MLPGLRAHVDSVTAHPAMIRSSMSQHQAEVKHVVSAMHADMMALGMHSDPAYEVGGLSRARLDPAGDGGRCGIQSAGYAAPGSDPAPGQCL
jgi:hypothetical protein